MAVDSTLAAPARDRPDFLVDRTGGLVLLLASATFALGTLGSKPSASTLAPGSSAQACSTASLKGARATAGESATGSGISRCTSPCLSPQYGHFSIHGQAWPYGNAPAF